MKMLSENMSRQKQRVLGRFVFYETFIIEDHHCHLYRVVLCSCLKLNLPKHTHALGQEYTYTHPQTHPLSLSLSLSPALSVRLSLCNLKHEVNAVSSSKNTLLHFIWVTNWLHKHDSALVSLYWLYETYYWLYETVWFNFSSSAGCDVDTATQTITQTKLELHFNTN